MPEKQNETKFQRREFLKKVAVTGALATTSEGSLAVSEAEKVSRAQRAPRVNAFRASARR
jgi:nitrous oxide reductase